MGASVVEYRTTRHPMLWPAVGLVLYSTIFVLPGIYFAAANHDALVLAIGLALCGGIAIRSFGFWVVALAIDDSSLTWHTPMRTGQVPLRDVRAVLPSPGNTRLKMVYPIVRMELRGTNAVIEIANHRSLTVAVFSGFMPFLDALRTRCPDAHIVTSPRWERLRRR